VEDAQPDRIRKTKFKLKGDREEKGGTAFEFVSIPQKVNRKMKKCKNQVNANIGAWE